MEQVLAPGSGLLTLSTVCSVVRVGAKAVVFAGAGLKCTRSVVEARIVLSTRGNLCRSEQHSHAVPKSCSSNLTAQIYSNVSQMWPLTVQAVGPSEVSWTRASVGQATGAVRTGTTIRTGIGVAWYYF